MLTTLTNEPRDYAWGSHTLIAELEGREASGGPEAEVWFGDHPSDPAELPDGTALDAWLAEHGEAVGIDGRLPYLLKILAADAPLSIQVHPSLAQARAGFARETLLEQGAARNYADDNHKPEMIVALRDGFRALCGLRRVDESLRMLRSLGAAAEGVVAHLSGDGLASTIGWLLSGDAQGDVDRVIGALDRGGADHADRAGEAFADVLANARFLAAAHPGDPGVVVALLMNLMTLRAGEAVFLRAGMLHAYVSGIGIEIMAASDNVLRGGLTPKHIDVDELMRILDPSPGEVQLVAPAAVADSTGAVEEFPVPVTDFSLLRAEVSPGREACLAPRGATIVLAVHGEVVVSHGEDSVTLSPGGAALATPESRLLLEGDGVVFVARPGA